MEESGDPGLIRTADKQFRKLLLYPSELRGHSSNFTRIVLGASSGFSSQQFRKLPVDIRAGP